MTVAYWCAHGLLKAVSVSAALQFGFSVQFKYYDANVSLILRIKYRTGRNGQTLVRPVWPQQTLVHHNEGIYLQLS